MEKVSIKYMCTRSHSRHCCRAWKIRQPNGTTTRSFKESADGSLLELHFVYGPDDGPKISEYWEIEWYLKKDGEWWSLDKEEHDRLTVPCMMKRMR